MLKEGEDYNINEEGLFVFTREYHLKRGFCCKSGCKHCPYGFKKSNELKTENSQKQKKST